MENSSHARVALLLGVMLIPACTDSAAPDSPGRLVVTAVPSATILEVVAFGEEGMANATPARSDLRVIIERTDHPFVCSVFGSARITLEDGRVGWTHIERPVPPPDEYPAFYCSLDPGENLDVRIFETDLVFEDIPWPPPSS